MKLTASYTVIAAPPGGQPSPKAQQLMVAIKLKAMQIAQMAQTLDPTQMDNIQELATWINQVANMMPGVLSTRRPLSR